MSKTGRSNSGRLVGIGLSILVLIGILFAIPFLSKSATNTPKSPILATPEQYLEKVNEERAKIEAPALVIDPKLNETAKSKADDMVSRGYYDHDAPYGKKWEDFIIGSVKPGSFIGENLDRCALSIDEDMVSWKKSPGHYKNIMDTKWRNFGSYSEINPQDHCMYVVNHFSS